MKKIFISLLLFLLGAEISVAQKLTGTQQKKVNELFAKTKVVYFKFPVSSLQEAQPLSKIISIDSNQGKMIFAHANKEAFSKFIVKGYPYTIVKKPASKTKKK
jgi:hypothetical protein